MIALCREHHAQADAGVFTRDQLHALKRNGRDSAVQLGERFNWMREELIAFVGGNFYVDVAVAVQVGRHPVVWFNRDEQDRVLVNLHLPTMSGEARIRMEDNFWIETGTAEDLECPPSGTAISARYENGDFLAVRFREVESEEAFKSRYPPFGRIDDALAEAGSPLTGIEIALCAGAFSFPVAVVEIELRIADSPVDLSDAGSSVSGASLVGNWVIDSPLGLVVRVPSNHPWYGISDFEKRLRSGQD